MATQAEELEVLYRAERARLARSASRLVGEHRAEDLVQDAFLTYLRHADEVTVPQAWLTRVTRNRALNDLRRSREVALDDEVAATRQLVPAERDAVRAAVAAALDAVDERSRRALVMRFFDEQDYPAIARTLGVRLPQAHVIVHRAVKRLGRELVRHLAAAHGTGEGCVSALEEMTGLGGRANGHGAAPCPACRPVLDEVAALRGAEALLPLPLASALRRLLDAVSAKGAAIAEPAGHLATMLLVVGLTVSPLAGPHAPESRPARAVLPPSAIVDAGASSSSVPPVRPARTGPVPEAVEPERIEQPEPAAEAGPVRITADDDHTSTTVDGGDEEVGVIACRPLELCPPPPGEGTP